MATIEHCLYCFEALDSTLSSRKPMTLSQVQSSWASYTKSRGDQDSGASSEDEDGGEEEPSSLAAKVTTCLSAVPKHLSSSSRSSTPASGTSGTSTSSSASLAPSTTLTTPASSSSAISTISESPLFVTWNVISPSTHEASLRGCVGTFESQPLSSGLASYALTSALSDHRFNPISSSELSSLSVSVTLLTDFEDADGPMDWELGTHGVRISFIHKGRRYGSCYLPDVATEQGWDREETIVSLMRKAGWGGRRDKWRDVDEDMRVVRYRGDAESCDWEVYKEWRKWVEGGGK